MFTGNINRKSSLPNVDLRTQVFGLVFLPTSVHGLHNYLTREKENCLGLAEKNDLCLCFTGEAGHGDCLGTWLLENLLYGVRNKKDNNMFGKHQVNLCHTILEKDK